MTLNGGASAAIPGGPSSSPSLELLYAGQSMCPGKQRGRARSFTVTEAADQTNWALTGIDIDSISAPTSCIRRRVFQVTSPNAGARGYGLYQQ